MANRRNYTRHSHKGLAIFCVILALLLVGGIALGGLQLWGKGDAKPSNWFKGEDAPAVEKESVKYETVLPANGGMILDEKIEDGEEDDTGIKSNGIALMSAAIPVAQYATYGISPAAETAKTVTATVSPDNEASNTKIKWELSWKNAASEWATGKEVTDYVTIQSNADDLMESKTCTVSCSQAFGEQIQLKAICVEDETKFATCNVDYVQQIKSASVAIGDVSVNLGGNTDITIAIRRDYGGTGGKVTVTPTYGEVYTIENEFTATASLTHEGSGQQDKKWLAYSYTSAGAPGGTTHSIRYDNQIGEDSEINGKSIYFDRRLFTQFNFFCGVSEAFHEESDSGLFTALEKAKDLAANFNTEQNYGGPFKNKILWTMKVTLTSSAYAYEYSYESDLVWAAIDETVPPTDVHINDDQDILFP